MGGDYTGNGSRRSGAQDPLATAAALRWYLAQSEAEAEPDEYLEYQGADLALKYIESSCPGLSAFFRRLGDVAKLAASLALARKAAAPEAALAAMEADLRAGWSELEVHRELIQCEHTPALLRSYAYVADVAHVMT